MLDLNITLLFQLVNFFVALILLNVLLIRPIRNIIRQRKSVMDGMGSEAASFEEQAAQRLADYEAQLQGARQEAGKNRAEARAVGAAEQAALVSAAQQEAQTIMAQARETLRGEADAAMSQLRGRIDEFADKAVARVLG